MKGAHAAIVLTDNQIGSAGVLIDDDIARLRHLFLARRELPDIRPHLFDFLPKKVGAGVARCGQRLRTHIFVGVLFQELRDRLGVSFAELSPARPWAPFGTA